MSITLQKFNPKSIVFLLEKEEQGKVLWLQTYCITSEELQEALQFLLQKTEMHTIQVLYQKF